MPFQSPYFVLDPHGTSKEAKAARRALRAYAGAIASHDPDEADRILEEVNRAELEAVILGSS